MTVCPWTGEIFNPVKKNQRFSSPAAKTSYHAAVRELGEMVAESFPAGLLRKWHEVRAGGPYTDTQASVCNMGDNNGL